MNFKKLLAATLLLTSSSGLLHAAPALPSDDELDGYLFVYFKGNRPADEAICYAVSDDALTFTALNDNQPIIDSRTVSRTGGLRDPHILRRVDGEGFYMVATDMISDNGWDSNRGMVLLKSPDLVTWTATPVHIPDRFPALRKGLKRVWAPQTIFDPEAGKYLIYWSMQHADGPDIIYSAYVNDDFTDFVTDPVPFFVPADGKSCIDGDIVVKDGKYYLFYKTEGHGNGIKVAVTESLSSGKWTESPDYKQLTKDPVEGAGTFRLNGTDDYVLMYDVYTKGRYEFTRTSDLAHFEPLPGEVKMNFHPRHGTIIPVTRAEIDRVSAAYPSLVTADGTVTASSPDGNLSVTLSTPGGYPSFSVSLDGKEVIPDSPLGLVANSGNYAEDMKLIHATVAPVEKSYAQTRIKQSAIDFKATRLVATFRNRNRQLIDVEMMIADNDIAFRYVMPKEGETGSIRVFFETTGFRFPESTTTFLCPQSKPMVGWKRTKPSYEEEYVLDAPMDSVSAFGNGFTFPCLFKVPEADAWVLLSETGVDSRYCASRLLDRDNSGAYCIGFPMPEENNGNGTVEPAFSLPGATPWRTISLGNTLAPIVESTIYWDVVDPLYEPTTDYKPGRGTWSWILWQDNSINPEDIRTYIDFAADMGYEHTLIDNWWDTNIGHDGMEDLFRYARSKGVEPLVWYSSSGYWNDIVQGPVNRMDNPIARKAEMKWLQKNGIKGIKVDFFGGDKQETMRLYEAILSDANDHGIMVIFHGCTLPRGWERMYPNYVGSEAVLASENIYFSQHFADEEARNAATHPFIRNAVGCMEFGGTFLNKHLNRGNDGGNTRRTSDVFELATTILFQNPIQNFALAPNNLTDAPEWAIDYMKAVPTAWDETRFIDGYPGRYVILARRHGDAWRIGAVNAGPEPLETTLDLSSFWSPRTELTVYSDDADLNGSVTRRATDRKGRLKVTIPVNGGLILLP
ncbi:MAG: glycoside hydrolase family 97 catalytic domain-containing protein [Muribaculaceae bacterium]|nr:glycoside hydrolase family 97 catalytic domain-containing protein [Muribaculaceae bacterium]